MSETMTQIPELTDIQVAMGHIGHLPKYDSLPEEFQREQHPACLFVINWFHMGADLSQLTPREGVDQSKALRALAAVLRSWEPKHEHKIAGAGYLLDQWFVVAPVPNSDREGE